MPNEIGIENFKDEISNDIISFLNDFAQKDRYFNFDSLTISDYKRDNPLEKWHKIQNKILDAYPHKPLSAQYLYLAKSLDCYASVYFTDLDGNDMTSLESLV